MNQRLYHSPPSPLCISPALILHIHWFHGVWPLPILRSWIRGVESQQNKDIEFYWCFTDIIYHLTSDTGEKQSSGLGSPGWRLDHLELRPFSLYHRLVSLSSDACYRLQPDITDLAYTLPHPPLIASSCWPPAMASLRSSSPLLTVIWKAEPRIITPGSSHLLYSLRLPDPWQSDWERDGSTCRSWRSCLTPWWGPAGVAQCLQSQL